MRHSGVLCHVVRCRDARGRVTGSNYLLVRVALLSCYADCNSRLSIILSYNVLLRNMLIVAKAKAAAAAYYTRRLWLTHQDGILEGIGNRQRR